MVKAIKATNIQNLPVDIIFEGSDNIRKSQTDVTSLKNTISDVGLLQPIIVRKSGEGYTIIDGARRFRALKELKVEELIIGREVIIDQDETEADATFKQIIANIQREDINVIELGHAFVKLKEKYGYNYNEIAEIICKTPHYVTAKVGLAKRLTPELQEMIISDWNQIKCIPNTFDEDLEKVYEPNVNVIEDIARLPAELQKTAYEFIKEYAMDKKEALKYLRSLKKQAEMLKVDDVVKNVADTNSAPSVSGPVDNNELQKYLKKMERDLEKLSARMKASEFMERNNVIPEIESLIEKLYALCSEFKAHGSISNEISSEIH
ncbi:MAG: ParB/RepB/Spo0J family partition protein [Dehalobacter sp.]|nr:ParB/RepB/Spo0J family partition protein [Dehalobacter sp.]